ncbi:MAG: hypothetical protein ACTS5I_00025 [Rhodanobacter sp.]
MKLTAGAQFDQNNVGYRRRHTSNTPRSSYALGSWRVARSNAMIKATMPSIFSRIRRFRRYYGYGL